MIVPCRLWLRKKQQRKRLREPPNVTALLVLNQLPGHRSLTTDPLVPNHLPNHQSPTTELSVLSHLPSHQSSPFLPKPRQTQRVWQRPNTSADRLPDTANATNLLLPLKTLPLRPTCLVTLEDSPHPPNRLPDHAPDHVLASTVAAAIASQVTGRVVTRRV